MGIVIAREGESGRRHSAKWSLIKWVKLFIKIENIRGWMQMTKASTI